MANKKLPTYDEILSRRPDYVFMRADMAFAEASDDETRASKERQRLLTAHLLAFLQDNELCRRTLFDDPLNIPGDFTIFLRDLMPVALDLGRLGLPKWLSRFDRNMHADPANVSILTKALNDIRLKNG